MSFRGNQTLRAKFSAVNAHENSKASLRNCLAPILNLFWSHATISAHTFTIFYVKTLKGYLWNGIRVLGKSQRLGFT